MNAEFNERRQTTARVLQLLDSSLPKLPGCGRRSTARFEIYSPSGGSSYGSLDGDVDLCDEHAEPAQQALAAAGLTAFKVPMATQPRRCGTGVDIRAGDRFAAAPGGWPPPGDDPVARRQGSQRRAGQARGWLAADIIRAARERDRATLLGLLSALAPEAQYPLVHTLAAVGPGAPADEIAALASDAAYRQVAALGFHLREVRP